VLILNKAALEVKVAQGSGRSESKRSICRLLRSCGLPITRGPLLGFALDLKQSGLNGLNFTSLLKASGAFQLS
jgi:hypothetical protein